ncbi:hypothetical protein KSX_95710 [Ktedonospora formicarum]|uniref:Uncharacterized protein n=1 Tax=Ktedonospora formicarum TaxID=2778364 RepID=A0A8J3IFI6_9CHLR|nr:hypothetical protein KSX_95710 [Ktedonospora formicarum]
MIPFWQVIYTLDAWHDGELVVIGVILLAWLCIGCLVSGLCRSCYPLCVSFVCVWVAMAGVIIMVTMQS